MEKGSIYIIIMVVTLHMTNVNHLNSLGAIFLVCQFLQVRGDVISWIYWFWARVEIKDNSGKVDFILNELTFFTTVITKVLS